MREAYKPVLEDLASFVKSAHTKRTTAGVGPDFFMPLPQLPTAVLVGETPCVKHLAMNSSNALRSRTL